MITPTGQCPFCLGIDVVQAGDPEGPTKLAWYQCHACRKMWFYKTGSPNFSCPACNGFGKVNTSTADSVVVTLRCASCGSEWLFRTTEAA